MWFRLADRLKKTLQEVKAGTTSSEFNRWCLYLEQEELKGFHRMDHLAAMVAAELHRCRLALLHRDSSEVKDEDFLLRFTFKPVTPELTDSQRTQRVERIKATVAARHGFAGRKSNQRVSRRRQRLKR